MLVLVCCGLGVWKMECFAGYMCGVLVALATIAIFVRRALYFILELDLGMYLFFNLGWVLVFLLF